MLGPEDLENDDLEVILPLCPGGRDGYEAARDPGGAMAADSSVKRDGS
ncbi:MAG: hypothetical protein MRJ92_01455 [Nitrospira sp.]|nr:hypothetical protein [Nitrospira sp.]